MLTGKKTDPFVTEEEKLHASTRVRINFSTGTNKTAAMLSGLFGGTLKCSESPAVKTFIQDRLNKKMPFPAKHAQVVD